MSNQTLFTIYWLTAPLVLAGLGWLLAWWHVRQGERDRAHKA